MISHPLYEPVRDEINSWTHTVCSVQDFSSCCGSSLWTGCRGILSPVLMSAAPDPHGRTCYKVRRKTRSDLLKKTEQKKKCRSVFRSHFKNCFPRRAFIQIYISALNPAGQVWGCALKKKEEKKTDKKRKASSTLSWISDCINSLHL